MNKKILIITSEFPPMPGGIGNHAFCLAKELSKLEYDITVLTEKREKKSGDWENFVTNNEEIDIKGIDRKKVIFLTYFQRLLNAYKLICRNSYKAVFYSGKFSVWLNGLMPKTRSIIVIHGSEIKQKGIAKSLFKRGLRKANQIVCVSKFTMEQLLSNYKDLDKSKIVVINNGVQNGWITEGKTAKKIPKPEQINLITVGGIHKRKGQFNVVKALPGIVKILPDAQYRIVGMPLEKEKLKNLINSEKVNEYVTFHHGLNDEQLIDILKESDIFMMLSEHLKNGDFEGFGIAIIEAMSLGLPAIGTQNSGIADAIKDGYSGKLVNPENTVEVINALKEIVNNYEQFSANAIEWADSFQWKRKVAEYQDLISKL